MPARERGDGIARRGGRVGEREAHRGDQRASHRDRALPPLSAGRVLRCYGALGNINSTEQNGAGARDRFSASRRRGFGWYEPIALQLHEQGGASTDLSTNPRGEDARKPLRVAGCNVPATRSLQTPRRSPSRRSPGGHSRGTAPSAHGLITPENTRRHDTGRLLGDDGHERRDLLGLERGVLHLLAVAVRRGVLRGREKCGAEKVSDSMRGVFSGTVGPGRGRKRRDATRVTSPRHGRAIEGRKARDPAVSGDPARFPLSRLGFQGLGPIWIEWAGRARRWSAGAPSWGGSWCGAWWPWG